MLTKKRKEKPTIQSYSTLLYVRFIKIVVIAFVFSYFTSLITTMSCMAKQFAVILLLVFK